MHELMFQAGVKGMSERSELIPSCIYIFIYIYIIILILHLSVRPSVRAEGHGKPFNPS